MLQTGTQILTGFLLALAFQPAFAALTAGQRTFYLVLVVLAALSTIIALSPVALHRAVFRHHEKSAAVAFGHAAVIAALVTVSLVIVGVVGFVFDVVVDGTACDDRGDCARRRHRVPVARRSSRDSGAGRSGREDPVNSELPIAIAQFAPTADRAANLAEIGALVARAAERGARVVLLPEYASYFVDPFDETLAENAEPLDGPFVTALAGFASAGDVVVVAGLVERGTGHRVRNTVVAVGPTGLLAHYRKVHLYDAFGQRESDWVEPGATDAVRPFAVDGLTFAIMTCYDLRFPR